MFHAAGLKRKSTDNEENHPSKKHASAGKTQYWMVLWRNPQTKKHKTWDGDGVLKIEGDACYLQDTDGTDLARAKTKNTKFESGDIFTINGKDVELDHSISEKDYLSGACFGIAVAERPTIPLHPVALLQTSHNSKATVPLAKKFQPPRTTFAKAPSTSKPRPSATESFDCDQSGDWQESSYWTACWRKPQTKTHKTWDGDGIVAQEGTKIRFHSSSGKTLGTSTWSGEPLRNGTTLSIGSKEIELGEETTAESYKAGHFKGADSPAPPADLNLSKFVAPALKATTARNFYGASAAPKPAPGKPRHDPDAENAIVMKKPDAEHRATHNKRNLPVVPVVVDPFIAHHLRPHQIEGIKFMYESVMGMRKHEGKGCILADEMGLGKTLQTIALIWTLLKQNPYGNISGVVGKVMVVCPVSLVNNWRKEFNKWLGRDRIGVFVGDTDKTKIKQFIHSKIHQVLIIGYEKLRSVIADLAYCNPPIGLIICDEGHRLKSANNKTSKMFDALKTTRRIILSGTPIQNDLSEFHAMADFCNPGLLDDYKTFNRIYEAPILKSREPNCSSKNLELGRGRSDQLNEISRSFVLRRTADILNNYLPPKTEYVVFVKPTSLQLSIFKNILSPQIVDDVVHGPTAKSLALITTLTKVCNSPMLLKKDGMTTSTISNLPQNVQAALKLLPSDGKKGDFRLSGKLLLLGQLLSSIRKHTDEKCILVSHYTSTLNILEEYCQAQKYAYFRLDGSTNPQKRQDYVDEFNRSSQQKGFVFLLSTKAGGVGLNLIGASRLMLIDSDWNPSHDLQAMARIHRDGQKRPVFIYRLLTAGTIDEKIFQRQIIKIGLSESLMGPEHSESGKSSKDEFSATQLKDLFTINPQTACNTHDLLNCDCHGRGPSRSTTPDVEEINNSDPESDDDDLPDQVPSFVVASQVKAKLAKAAGKKRKDNLAALKEWTHVDCLRPSASEYIQDTMLQHLLSRLPSAEDAMEEDEGSDYEFSSGSKNTASLNQAAEGAITFVFERQSKTGLNP